MRDPVEPDPVQRRVAEQSFHVTFRRGIISQNSFKISPKHVHRVFTSGAPSQREKGTPSKRCANPGIPACDDGTTQLTP